MERPDAEEKKLTGYPSIDKPWLKYYSDEVVNATIPKCTIYEYLYENNKNYLDDIVINYVGRKITYREMFENIDRLAITFSEEGIVAGDIVTIIAPSIPEVIYTFYALNKIGAVSNFVDPRKSAEEVDLLLGNMPTKACIVLDDMWEKFYEVLQSHAKLLISVTISDSLVGLPKFLMKLKGKNYKNSQIVELKQLELKHKDSSKDVKVSYKPSMLALIEYTGGTTGTSKGVMLSNENVNAVIEQTTYSGVPIKRGETWLSVAFPFTAYSLICSQHMLFSLGLTTYLCFDLEIEKVEKQLLKNKINHMANTPLMWEQLINSKCVEKMDLSFIIAPTVGADSLDIPKEKQINEFLEKHNCAFKVCKGYGMTEVSSGICITPNNEVNKLGSVGIPFNLTTVAIFDLDTEKELTYGEQGEICIQGPSVMLGYHKNEEANQEILRRHADGQIWLHSRDLGHMDEDGFVFIDGRIKRMIIDSMGFKIFAPVVENVIYDVPEVEKCCVVGAKDTENNVGQIPIAFIIPKKDADENTLRKDIMKACAEQLPTYSYPSKIIFKETFPYTSAAKVDYRALEVEANKEQQKELVNQ